MDYQKCYSFSLFSVAHLEGEIGKEEMGNEDLLSLPVLPAG